MGAVSTPTECDVAIVGGGPAGQAAALILAGHGLSVTVIDEQLRPGGQILRQPPEGRMPGDWIAGRAYRGLRQQLAKFEAAEGVRWIGRSSVIGIWPDADSGHVIEHTGMAGTGPIRCRSLLIAAGCYDMPVPLPGWTLPGVLSVGGVQTLLKGQGLVAGKRIVLAGTHPLMLVAAQQLHNAGAEIAGVLFAQPLPKFLGTAARQPLTVLRYAETFFDAAVALLHLRRARVPVHFGTGLSRIEGQSEVTAAVSDKERIACDTVALCYGFLPQSDLPRLAGARMHRAEPAGGWQAEHDSWMRSSVAGLYVAGETTGVKGAEAALLTGQIAALGMLLDVQKITPEQAEQRASTPRRRLVRAEEFARLFAELADPKGFLPPLDDATVICRCETVTAGAITQALARQPGPASANALKLESRAGMGLCQGRGCEHSVLRLLGQLGSNPASAFAVQFPARPVSIRDLIGLAPDATQSAAQDH